MTIRETELTEHLLAELIAMSSDWASENSTYGYYPNGRSDIEGNRIFLAEEDGRSLGYLLGHGSTAKNASSIMPVGTAYFEIEELYVRPEHRGRGIGRALYAFAEERVKAEGIGYLMLSTATKDYKKILHFYIEELGMEFWSARLWKRLGE